MRGDEVAAEAGQTERRPKEEHYKSEDVVAVGEAAAAHKAERSRLAWRRLFGRRAASGPAAGGRLRLPALGPSPGRMLGLRS